MRIIISPAKHMRVDTDSFVCTELPVFTECAELLKEWIRSLSYGEQQALWACNDKIARQNGGQRTLNDEVVKCTYGPHEKSDTGPAGL